MAERKRMQSELWFEGYCAAHGINVVAYEPDLGVGKRPDYLIETDGVEVVCEVKEFETTPIDELMKLGRFFMTSETVELKPIRGQVRQAARQLKPLDGSKWPLVVVLANPGRLHVPLDPNGLIHALYGDLTISFEIGEHGSPVSEPRGGAGRHGRLRNDHRYISAVIALRQGDLEADWWHEWHERYGPADAKTYEEAIERAKERSAAAERAEREEEIPKGEYYRVDVVRNWSKSAAPLPAEVFAGDRDTLWEFDENEAAYARSRPAGP